MSDDDGFRPPARLRELTQWQISKVATLGARITGSRMHSGGRADFAVLAALEEYGALSQAELGRRLGLDRNDVNGVINRLAAAGGLERATDPTDRRRNVITMTPAGVGQLEELLAQADAVQRELLQGLDHDEQRQLRSLLAKVLASHAPQPA